MIEILGRKPLFHWDDMRDAPTEEIFLALTPFTLNIVSRKIHSFMEDTLDPGAGTARLRHSGVGAPTGEPGYGVSR